MRDVLGRGERGGVIAGEMRGRLRPPLDGADPMIAWCVCSAVSGTALFGYVIGSTTALLSSRISITTRTKTKMSQLNSYMDVRGLPRHLRASHIPLPFPHVPSPLSPSALLLVEAWRLGQRTSVGRHSLF